jgi:hypothetical protein
VIPNVQIGQDQVELLERENEAHEMCQHCGTMIVPFENGAGFPPFESGMSRDGEFVADFYNLWC